MAEENVAPEAETPAPTPVEDAAAKLYPDTDTPEADKPVEAEPSETDPKTDEEEKVGAPEEYKDFDMPEDVELDKDLVDAFKPMAKELDLSQEKAQKLVDMYNEHVGKMQESQQKAWEDVKTDWANSAKEDKEYGGEKFDENIGFARKALEKFGSPELKEALDTTGVGNHPEFIRAFVRIGKAIAEDGVVTGSNPAGAPKDRARTMFPDMN